MVKSKTKEKSKTYKPNINVKKSKLKSKSNEKINIYKIKSANLKSYKLNSDECFIKKNKNMKHKSNIDDNKYKNLNEQELNSLEYELALKYDKRTYFQYYWSLLKRKQLILFSFLPNNDYNLRTIKISLFLISFSLYFTINGFFFSDNTMHKVYEDKGKFNIIFQIPQILYSTMVSAVINIILKTLSLSEKNILELKEIIDKKKQ